MQLSVIRAEIVPTLVKNLNKKDGTPIYELKVELRAAEPPVWRRILVPGDITLAELHHVIQRAMGWTNSHLHQFVVGPHRYSDPEFELEPAKSEFGYSLTSLVPSTRKKFTYLYDFGDEWIHVVRVERIVQDDPRYPGGPFCISGARACPPEDCGGAAGYDEFLEAIRNKKHVRHEEVLEWIGGNFDPEHFDRDEVNRALAEIRLNK